jgi:stage II sporulation protein AA (anti-sigma F factor antagonist)
LNVKHFIEDKILIFEITEELDHHASDKIRKRTDYEIQRFMPKRVIFDFKRVNFMDSAGIGLIIGRYKQAECYGGKLEMMNVNEKVKRVFEMSGILKIIPILDDQDNEKIC